jgi:hypothetical protein
MDFCHLVVVNPKRINCFASPFIMVIIDPFDHKQLDHTGQIKLDQDAIVVCYRPILPR